MRRQDFPPPLRAEADHDDDSDGDDAGHQRERERIVSAVRLSDLGLERTIIGSEEITGLIDEGRNRCARRAWRQFVEMGWNDTPGPLHRDLHDEGPEREQN